MSVSYQAVLEKFPDFRSKLWDGTDNSLGTTSVIYFTADVAHKVHELPEEFCGKYCRVDVSGGDLYFAFTDKSTHEIDRTIAATDAGTRDQKLGGFCKDGTFRSGRVPSAPKDGKIYFAREATAAVTVRIEIASD